jgi:lipoprotein-anchoring transpeptidase ErfK/SrfK
MLPAEAARNGAGDVVMRRFLSAIIVIASVVACVTLIACVTFSATPAGAAIVPEVRKAEVRPSVIVAIRKSAQRMSVAVDGKPRYNWVISTGRRGFGTPSGTYRPKMLARSWFSRKYYNSPMPYSIFFHRGYAIHGTNYLRQLGGPASHGCVRLHPGNAAVLFALVRREGMAHTRIVVTN